MDMLMWCLDQGAHKILSPGYPCLWEQAADLNVKVS